MKKLLRLLSAFLLGIGIACAVDPASADITQIIVYRIGSALKYSATTQDFLSDTDSSRIYVCGGSTESSSNSSCVYLNGVSGPSASNAGIFTGNGANSVLQLASSGSSGSISLETAGTQRFKITNSYTILGGAATGTDVFFGTNSVDGTDSNRLILGSGSTNALTRGAKITLDGNEVASDGGNLYVAPGAVANALARISLQDINSTAGMGFSVEDANFGARRVTRIKTSSTGALSGATSTLSNFIPAGTYVYGIVCRVTTTITGATSWTLGDGTTADLWGTGIALSANTQTASTNFKSTWDPHFYSAANNVVLTATGSNFTGGVVRCSAIYDDMLGPTG